MSKERGRRGRHTAAHTSTSTHTHGAAESGPGSGPGPARPARRRLRRGAAGTALAALAVAALTASQAPGVAGAKDARAPWTSDRADAPYQPGTPDDGAYHTELPPLATQESNLAPRALDARVAAESGIPATVLQAYKNAEKALRGASSGCHLPWQLLAAIGKVESGQARGGDVKADGTTRTPILGPVLDGGAFAHIGDTDGGAYDGDSTYDRAVGPMQFIPSTWKSWGADGNGDGKKDPHNIHDAALAAGRYLCANDRDLSRAADLRRAVLSYNQSTAYLRTVLAWFDFYRTGAHAVPDGEGVLPGSPGAGSDPDSGGKKGAKSEGKNGTNGKNGKGGAKEKGKGGGGKDTPGKGNGNGGGGGGSDPGGEGPGPGDPDPGPTDTASPGPTDPGDPDPSDPPGCDDGTSSPPPSPTDPPTTTPPPSPSPTDSEGPCETGKR